MRILLYVAIGGGVGSALRYLVALGVGTRAVPWATIGVNVAGSALLGFLVGWLADRPIDPAVQIGLLTGVLGGFTTFSTFTVETVALVEAGRWQAAFTNVTISLVAGFGAAAAGLALARMGQA